MAIRICLREAVSEKVTLLHLLGKEKKITSGEVAKIYSKNKFPIHKIVKEKEICASFALAPQTRNTSHHVGVLSSYVIIGRVRAAQ